MESDIARILVALVLALPGYFWWKGLRRTNPKAANRYALGVAGLAIAMVMAAVVVSLLIPDGGGAWPVALAMTALFSLAAAAIAVFLAYAMPPAVVPRLNPEKLKRAVPLLVVLSLLAAAALGVLPDR